MMGTTIVVFVGSTALNDVPLNPGALADSAAGNLARSGRAVVVPVLRGTFQRYDGLRSNWPNESQEYVDYVESWVIEFRRTIDYLESRPDDFDADKLAYLGLSWGARMGAIIPAVEDRLDLAMLVSGGLASGRAQPQVDQINYVSRVYQPTLMLNGAYDAIEPVEEAQIPMFELLGTSLEDKRRVVIEDAGHAVPRIPATREILAWLDRYFGEVSQ